MLGFIALPAALAVVVFVTVFVILRKRRRQSWRNLNDLSPVSGQWLAERRRSG
jgi:hypothetical protein